MYTLSHCIKASVIPLLYTVLNMQQYSLQDRLQHMHQKAASMEFHEKINMRLKS